MLARAYGGLAMATTMALLWGWCFAATAQADDLIIDSLRVKATKADGKTWDVLNGKPDLKVVVERDGATNRTSTQQDTYSASFRVKTIRIKPGDQLTIVVYDEDVANDDVIGSTNLEVTAELLAKGKADLQFDQVLSLKLEFAP